MTGESGGSRIEKDASALKTTIMNDASQSSNPIDLVRRGYNQIASAYHLQRDQLDNRDLLEQFRDLVATGGRVLDVGCGAGVPVMKFLVDSGFRSIGVDIAANMLSLSARHAPEARIAAMGFGDATFDGLISTYAIFHAPREKHFSIFNHCHRILRPSSTILVSVGRTDWEGVEDFHGADMYWSHYAADSSVRLIENAGFDIQRVELRESSAPGDGAHCWVLAIRK